ncbi:MAG: peptide chain release factor N(5)-glutamine methyltransferase [Erysipelotrichaceae bacterium]|nr:peptide chain release factor N(5)-glutamine methyltransferase [Erysipelotrichaceae bacterium]MDY6034600.1 peptide chain release factor N(5)-glutamine methyltransferase [Bulleidia sp.]
MSTFAKTIKQYERECEKQDIPTETVLAYLVELTQRDRYDLFMHIDDEIPDDLASEFHAGMDRILHQEPMAHVLGYSWFYGYKMIVNEDVLIPRSETEELCAQILARIDEHFSNQATIECADVGTGSGAIAITVAKEEKKVRMHATDISEEALVTARKNAENNEVSVEFKAGDMLQPLIDGGLKLDVLISNPPYIPQDEKMETSVVDFEPHVALFGGQDGLKFYRMIFKDCRKVLKDKAFMAFEMGWDQRERMSQLVKEMLPEARYEIIKDMNGKDRMLFVYFNC